MRIGVDFNVVAGKNQGSKTYLLGLYSSLAERFPQDEIFVYYPGRANDLIKENIRFKAPNFVIREVGLIGGPLSRLYLRLPYHAARDGLDIMHTQYILPEPMTCRRVVTVHDILFETHPHLFPNAFGLRLRLLVRRAVSRADLVFTVSQQVRGEIITRYRLPPAKVVVAPNGLDNESLVECGDLSNPFGLESRSYVLMVGRLEKRKNLETVVAALQAMGSEAPILVLVGKEDLGYSVNMTLSKLSSRCMWLRDLSNTDLRAIYKGALCLLFPSLAEGFGLPIIEAMQSGIPVISSNTTSMPEVVGNAGILLGPHDSVRWAEAIRSLMHKPKLRDDLVLEGRKRAALFDWKVTADIFRRAIEC